MQKVKQILIVMGFLMGTGTGFVWANTNATAVSPASDTKRAPLTVMENYIIGPEDVLMVSIWKNKELSGQVVVRPDGKISLPLIGDAPAAGLTPTQLKAIITEDLKGFFQVTPTVSIIVGQVNSQAIFVLGEIKSTGKYPLKSRTTLLQALTIAGGFTPIAARNRIVVFRRTEDGKSQIKLKASYDDIVLRQGIEQNYELMPGDTVVVPSESMVLIP